MPLRNEVLDDRRFWALMFGYFFGQIGEAPEIDIVCSLLDVSSDSVEKWTDEFTRYDQGLPEPSDGCLGDLSTILLPVANGVSLRVEFQPGDCFWDLVSNGEQRSVLLGNIGGHWALPGLRWPEAVRLAGVADSASMGIRQTILLLLPIVWLTQGDDVDSAQRLVESAWSDCGLARGSAAASLAESWVRAVANGMNYRWHLTAAGGWVTDARWSARGGQRPEALVLEINRRLAAACGRVLDL